MFSCYLNQFGGLVNETGVLVSLYFYFISYPLKIVAYLQLEGAKVFKNRYKKGFKQLQNKI